jgi:hypothetical protein
VSVLVTSSDGHVMAFRGKNEKGIEMCSFMLHLFFLVKEHLAYFVA